MLWDFIDILDTLIHALIRFFYDLSEKTQMKIEASQKCYKIILNRTHPLN